MIPGFSGGLAAFQSLTMHPPTKGSVMLLAKNPGPRCFGRMAPAVCVFNRTPPRRRLAYFALVAITLTMGSSGSAEAPPLPAGYERWMAPKVKHHRTEGMGESYSGVWYNVGFNKGKFIVDFDITEFEVKPSTEADSNGHGFAAIEVASDGPLGPGETDGEPNDWVFAYGQDEEGMAWVLNDGPPNLGAEIPTFPAVGNALPALRPTSFELYFRHDPHTGEEEATYAFVAVENVGKHFANWEFIQPVPIAVLEVILENLPFDTRPYEIEFARDLKGQIWGAALLTHDEQSGTLPVPWATTWFEPWQIPNFADDGFQLMDLELNQGIFPGVFEGFIEKTSWPSYFGVFVHTSYVADVLTMASVMDPTSEEWLEAAEQFGKSRLIDLEYAGKGKKLSAGKEIKLPLELGQAEAEILLFATVWLDEDD